MGIKLGLALILLITVVVLSRLLSRKRQSEWHDWAKSHRLAFSESNEGLSIEGTLRNRQVNVSTTTQGSDTEGSVVIVRVAVCFHAPEHLRARSRIGLIEELSRETDVSISLGDEEFDRAVEVQSPHEEEAKRYWTESRKQCFLDLIAELDADTHSIERAELIVTYRSVIPDGSRLDKTVFHLIDVAESLEADRL